MVIVMKKLIIMIATIITISLIFAGCTGNDELFSPIEIEAPTLSSESNYDVDNISTIEMGCDVNHGGDYGGSHLYIGRFRDAFYSLPAPFIDLVGWELHDPWCESRSPEERENESVIVSFIRYFNISREQVEQANEEMQRIAEAWGLVSNPYPVDLIFTFDNERINDYFRWHNSPRVSERGMVVYPEVVIPSVAINVPAPIAGARAESGMPEIDWSLNYLIHSIEWSPNIMPFAADTTYTVTAIISARSGYTLNGLTTATINGNPAVISHNTGITARISYTFTDEAPSFRANQRIAKRGSATFVLKEDGTVWGWGINSGGLLGDGSFINRNIPVQILNLANVRKIATNFAIKEDGTVWGWGNNNHGQLGDGTTFSRNVPVQIRSLTNITKIGSGLEYAVALKENGTVWAWGSNNRGQLGDGTTTNRLEATQVRNLINIVEIAVGQGHSLALGENGTVWAWGNNMHGQLGDRGTSAMRSIPIQVQNLTNVVAVSAGSSHSVALKEDGTVWAWGINLNGQLGDGTSINRNLPVQVQNIDNVIDIRAGLSHTIALKEDGTVWAWGWNQHGQLGDGTMINSSVPVQVNTLANIISIEVHTSASHSVALREDGTVWAWGNNTHGQIGDGTNAMRPTPVQVRGAGNIGFLNLYESVTQERVETVAGDMVARALEYVSRQHIEGEHIIDALINIDIPVTGAEPSHITDSFGKFTVSDVIWLNAGDIFSENQRYTVNIVLVAEKGFSFNGLMLPVINNSIATVVHNTGDTVTLSLEFPETE